MEPKQPATPPPFPEWMEDGETNQGMKPATYAWAFKTRTRTCRSKGLLLIICMFADPFTGEWILDSEDFSPFHLGKQAYRTALADLTDLGLVTRQRLESGRIRYFLPTAPRGLVPDVDDAS